LNMKLDLFAKSIRRLFSGTLSLLWCVSVPLGATLPNRQGLLEQRSIRYAEIIQSETQWLSETALSNGAIAFRPISNGETYINPYFSCYTILALLNGSPSAERITLCQNAIDWHFSHLNSQVLGGVQLAATIFDYTAVVKDGVVVSEHTDQTQDSTDSYSAAFILVLDAFAKTKNGASYLIAHKQEFLDVLSVMLATLSNDGLTFAKPDYKIAYLMDNCEVLYALKAAERLLKEIYLPDASLSAWQKAALEKDLARAVSAQKIIAHALESTLWNAGGGYYAPYLSSSQAASFDPEVFYADAVSQLCPIIYGVISPQSARAKKIYQTFCAHWDWETLSHVNNGDTSYYWGIIAYCAALMGDSSRLDRFLKHYQNEIMPSHDMPIFNSDAAWVVLACQQALRDCKEELSQISRFHMPT